VLDAREDALVADLGASCASLTPGLRVGVPVQIHQDVEGRAHEARHRIDRRDFSHALAIALLAGGQRREELAHGLARGPLRGGAQIVGHHDDALAVEGQHQTVVGAFEHVVGGAALGVECLEVGGGAYRDLFDLPFAEGIAGRGQQLAGHVVERHHRHVLPDEAAHAVRVQLRGQVERCVHRMQSVDAQRLIRQSRDHHSSQDRVKRTSARTRVGAFRRPDLLTLTDGA
jgi:hypothetical protein